MLIITVSYIFTPLLWCVYRGHNGSYWYSLEFFVACKSVVEEEINGESFGRGCSARVYHKNKRIDLFRFALRSSAAPLFRHQRFFLG